MTSTRRGGLQRTGLALCVFWACGPCAQAAEPPAACAALAPPADPGGAHDCLVERERAWGRDDPRVLAFLEDAAAAFAGDEDTALSALPYRRRAWELTRQLHGPGRETADAALAYAKTWLLSGHCSSVDPRLRPLVTAAAEGYALLPPDDPARAEGLRAAALAYADGLAFDKAAATTLLISPDPAAEDWRRIGNWRAMAGDPQGASMALRAAWDKTEDPFLKARLGQSLRRLYFELGDEAAAKEIEGAGR